MGRGDRRASQKKLRSIAQAKKKARVQRKVEAVKASRAK